MTVPLLSPVTLRHRWDEAVDLVGLRFEADDAALPASFTLPGQYAVVRVGGPEAPAGYFALASRPGDPVITLLVKAQPDGPAAALLALAPGDRAEMSTAMGAGFPVQEHRGKDVLLLAVGSGISPIRPLVWWLAAHRADFAGITLFHGARTRAHLAFQDEVVAWQAAGVQVVRVLSQEPAGPEAGWAEGYVQGALDAHPVDPARTVAFVCGMPGMVEGVKAALARRGLPAEAVLQNF